MSQRSRIGVSTVWVLEALAFGKSRPTRIGMAAAWMIVALVFGVMTQGFYFKTLTPMQGTDKLGRVRGLSGSLSEGRLVVNAARELADSNPQAPQFRKLAEDMERARCHQWMKTIGALTAMLFSLAMVAAIWRREASGRGGT